MGMISEGTGNLTIRSCTGSTTLAPRLLFSASLQPDEKLRSDGQSIFEISDFAAFADALTQSEPELLRSPQIGKVSYQRRDGFANWQEPIFPDPFIKSEKFAFEREVRIVWAPTNERARYQRIRSPQAAAFIKAA